MSVGVNYDKDYRQPRNVRYRTPKCLFVGILPIICTRIGCMWITHRPSWCHSRVQLTICQVRAIQSIVMSHFDKQQNLSARPFSLQRKQGTLGFVLFNANVRTASSAPLQSSTADLEGGLMSYRKQPKQLGEEQIGGAPMAPYSGGTCIYMR